MPLYQGPQPVSPPSLIVPRSEAKTKIEAQMRKGSEIRNFHISSEEQMNIAISEETKWRNVNIALLQNIFSNTSRADEYASVSRRVARQPSFTEEAEYFRRCIGYSLTDLESIIESLEFIPELVLPQIKSLNSTPLTRKIFVVHGHDEGTREAVARCLHQLDLLPIILFEQPNQGQTIIEKFEQSSSDISYAVVLLTPDDIGASKNKSDDLRPRARQNVIFELGYFAAKLGRRNVCALHKGGIEIPSDYQGVVYVSMDLNDWKWRLALEIKQVIPVDLNLLS